MADLRRKGPAGSNILTASEAVAAMAAGELTPERLVLDCLERIQARDSELRAWAYVAKERALDVARSLDRAPRRGPLHGIPVGVKDVLDTFDMPTEYGSIVYKDGRPVNDSACVAALRRAGAVILGKTATTEFASPLPIGVKNPHDLARTPGVSSSGSAVAVADFMVALALGTQTGGSVIRPAAYCGIYGYKATLDNLDRGGIRHLRPSLDTLGLFARALADIALLRAAMIGKAADASAWPEDRVPRIGVCRSPDWSMAKAETQEAFSIAEHKLRAAGAQVSYTVLPGMFAAALEAFKVISTVELARALQCEFRDHLETMNPWLSEVAEMAPSITKERYESALSLAADCRAYLSHVFTGIDALMTPAAAGEASIKTSGLEDQSFCPLWTMMHGPCVTIPAFTGPNNMPMGLQIVGPVMGDDQLIRVCTWIAEVLAPLPIQIGSG